MCWFGWMKRELLCLIYCKCFYCFDSSFYRTFFGIPQWSYRLISALRTQMNAIETRRRSS